MGWVYYGHRNIRCYADERAEIARLCTFENGNGRSTKLLRATKVGTTWYAAARVQNADGSPVETTTYVPAPDGSYVFGAVFLTRYDDGCWGYKDMDETVGPTEARAPRSILKLLSEIKDPDSYAINWRKRCEEWASIPNYQEGDKIKLAEPAELTDGSKVQILEVTHYPSGRRKMRCYRDPERDRFVRLDKGRLLGSELIRPAAASGSDILAEFFARQAAG